MKWAILSDVHGNLEALQSVIADLYREKAERIAFLGDAVGYGADPNECLLLLRERTEWMVAGNHDWGAVGLTEVSYFNPAAKAAVLWTGKKLLPEAGALLRQLPLLRQVAGITLVHATPHEPGEWNYIFTFPEAEKAFHAMPGGLAFIGHSHSPLILAKRGDGKVTLLQEEEATLEKAVRYIINVGSVGQPRDGDPRAAYGLYDEAERRFILKRVPYDIAAAQQKIISAGLPRSLARRLSEGS
jgi:diadenosine tetraphosphatase ApaH/serine/threonine PP2A family protein phosphatase